MQLEDLLLLYERMKDRYGLNTYNHISELLKEAKQIHKRIFLIANELNVHGRIRDHKQSWRSFKGQILEKLTGQALLYLFHHMVSAAFDYV